MRPNEVMGVLKKDGAYELSGKKTSHKQFKHPVRKSKDENMYLQAWESGSDAPRGIKTWIDDYNKQNRDIKSS